MKDYYYILGVNKNASEQELKTAHKKLSMLFHPDRNGGDVFFEERFKEIQEAYETLSDAETRKNYDSKLQPNAAKSSVAAEPDFSDDKPQIVRFELSKKAILEGDLVTLSWQVAYADSVHLYPLGMVEKSGTKTIRLPNLVGYSSIELILTATNTFNQEKVEKKVEVLNKSYKGDNPRPVPNPNQIAAPKTKKTSTAVTVNQPKKEKAPPTIYFKKGDFYIYTVMAVMAVLAVVMVIAVYKLSNQT